MGLKYHPLFGAVLLCRYGAGFTPPEMVKPRPVVVITPRLRTRSNLCTVVPLSLTEPIPVEKYHYKLRMVRPLPPPWDAEECWVKADMFSTVSYERLEPFKLGRGRDGKRQYYSIPVPAADMKAIQGCVLAALNLWRLTEHL
jgi:mRNA interferase MazF